jgi:poly-beta-hydroxyalkanoate depolymerase
MADAGLHGVGLARRAQRRAGVFSGRTWQNQIYPMVKNVILQSD